MPITKTILKKTRQQAVVRFLSSISGAANVTLNELALSDETIDNANAKVAITGCYFNSDGTSVISRGSTNVLILPTGPADWDFTQSWGFRLDEEANANVQIDVDMAGSGTVILVLSKYGGFTPPDQQSLQPRDR